MNAVRMTFIALVCLGLGLPSAHGIALCVDSEGSFTLEAVLNGACAGAQDSRCGSGEEPHGEMGLRSNAVDHCGSCRDVVFSRDGHGPPLPKNPSAQRPSRDDGGASSIVAEGPLSDQVDCCLVRQVVTGLPVHRPPPRSTVVLQL